MKKIFFAGFLLLMAYADLQAQNRPNCSIILCTEIEDDDSGDELSGVFYSFKQGAVGGETEFKVFVMLQNFSPDYPHVYHIDLVSPTGATIIAGTKSSFLLARPYMIHTHRGNWTAEFETAGMYTIKVYVDDIVVEEYNLAVGLE